MIQKSKIKNQKSKLQRGFTLIELLIVISIIGILATLLMANFVGVRQRGRDGQRKSDLRQIQSALELYRADQGSYPNPLPDCGASLVVGSSTYMQKIPCDPINSSPYLYAYSSNGTTYAIIACLENVNDSQKDTTSVSPCDTSGVSNTSFTLQNP